MSGDSHLPAWLSEDSREPMDLASIPYLERQTIVVVSDAEATEARSALRGAALAPPSDKQLQVPDRLQSDPLFALALASAVERGWISRSGADLVTKGLPYLPIVTRRARDFQKAFKAWRRARTATLLISTTEQTQLRWPKGDPVRDQVYAGSPADPRTYYPLASFHDDVFFERASELRRLLSRLGACRVMAKHVVIGGSSGRGRLIGRGEQFGGPISARAGKRASRELEEMFDREMSSGVPKSREEVTRDLHWIAKEPDWQELIDERFADRLRKDKLMFRADTDYGLGAGVQAALRGLPADVKVGGKFKRYERRQIELEVEFDPLPD